jgi:hypothetical protein
VNGGIWLAKRIQQEPRLRQRFLYSDGIWKMNEMHAYGKKIKIFRRNVMPVMHMGGGEPARGTEFVIIQYKNGANGNIRDMFINNEIMAFVALYNKTTEMNAQTKVIY